MKKQCNNTLIYLSGLQKSNMLLNFALTVNSMLVMVLQVEKMRNAGLIKGGGVENAIVCRSDASFP